MKNLMQDVKYRAKVRGDAGLWMVDAIDWLNQRVFLEGARANWHLIEKIQDLMRYTGFDDDQGDPIFFEDYVAYAFYDEDDVSACEHSVGRVVESMNHGVAILIDGYVQDIWNDEDMWRFRVIGNYYQNRELEKWADYHSEKPKEEQDVGRILCELVDVLSKGKTPKQPIKSAPSPWQ